MIDKLAPVMPNREAPWDREAFMTDLRARIDANRAQRLAARDARIAARPAFTPDIAPRPAAPSFTPSPAITAPLANRKLGAVGGGGGADRVNPNTKVF